MCRNSEGMGYTMVPFGQGVKDRSPPTKDLMRFVLRKQLAHGGNPVLRWMADNVTVKTDPAENIKLDKEKSTERIDGMVALVMALARAVVDEDTTSVYEDRGVITF